MPKGVAKYYLYKESMLDDSGVPVAEPLKSFEAEDAYQAAQVCIREQPPNACPKLEDYCNEEGWAQISISKGNSIEILEICNIDFKDIANL